MAPGAPWQEAAWAEGSWCPLPVASVASSTSSGRAAGPGREAASLPGPCTTSPTMLSCGAFPQPSDRGCRLRGHRCSPNDTGGRGGTDHVRPCPCCRPRAPRAGRTCRTTSSRAPFPQPPTPAAPRHPRLCSCSLRRSWAPFLQPDGTAMGAPPQPCSHGGRGGCGGHGGRVHASFPPGPAGRGLALALDPGTPRRGAAPRPTLGGTSPQPRTPALAAPGVASHGSEEEAPDAAPRGMTGLRPRPPGPPAPRTRTGHPDAQGPSPCDAPSLRPQHGRMDTARAALARDAVRMWAQVQRARRAVLTRRLPTCRDVGAGALG